MINLNINKKVFNDTFFPLLEDYSHRWEVYMGSAGSGKSHFITQKIIIRCCNEKIRVLVCRKYGTTIRQTVFELFKQVLRDWKLTEFVVIHEGDFRIKFPNGSEIIFTGLDQETKLLSLAGINSIWVEEIYEVEKDIIDQIDLRLRGGYQQQIIMSFNPISSQSWLYEFVNNPPRSFIFHHSTYKDNKYLSKEYIETLEQMKVRNPQKARIYCYGEWGIDTDGLVFTNWKTEEFDQVELSKKFEHRVGSDLGFIDPTTVISSFYDRQNKTIYVADEYYQRGVQLSEVYQAIIKMGLSKSTIWFDSAEPRTIDYFRRQNLRAKPCIKGPNSVDARIAFLQDHQIIVHPKCKNMIAELSNFSYERNKTTGKYIDGKYTHEFSHAIDGLGYSYSDIYSKGNLHTINKGVLGL